MRTITTTMAVLLAGCSEGTPAAPPTPAATASASPAPIQTEAPAPAMAVPPKPGPAMTFGDWYVACDNIAICTMASLGGESQVPFPAVTLSVTRGAGPGGGFELAFDTPGDDAPVRPVAVTVDGRRLPLPTLTGTAATALVAAIADGQALTVLEEGDRRRATLSLKGAAAALRWIDERQGRVDTVTAAVAKGPRPVDAVPAAARAPVIEALNPAGTAATPTPAQLAEMRRRARCESLPGVASTRPEAHPLGGGATLVMVPCSTGAYNLSSALFVLADGAWRPAQTDAPSGFDATPAGEGSPVPSVVNGDWQRGVLTSYAKGRGLGDCGVAQTFVWDGTRLRLSEQSMMGECRGNPNYITTWRTRVVRR